MPIQTPDPASIPNLDPGTLRMDASEALSLTAADITLSHEEIARIDMLARADGRMVSPDSLAPIWDD
ncbi:hypothetical protein [Sagittula sp. SSi028]|uniref:hypothetical protein n=1 Tax=Sagittula sp. SSi028 TaxID=3400636 RepID=UPI003AF5A199